MRLHRVSAAEKGLEPITEVYQLTVSNSFSISSGPDFQWDETDLSL